MESLKKLISKIWHDPVGSQVVAWSVIGLLALASTLLPSVRAWVFERLDGISRLQVIGWFALGAVLGGALVALVLRARRTEAVPATSVEAAALPRPRPVKSFEPFPVVDERLSMEWRVMRDPATWLDASRSTTHAEIAIDGPFHADPTCNARLHLKSTYNEMLIYAFCPLCRQQLFAGGSPQVNEAKKDVMEELRRQDRLGNAPEPGQVLQYVGYWNSTKPVVKQST